MKDNPISVLFIEVFKRWKNDGGPRLGASLSFYTAFSLTPVLLLSISIAGFFFGQESAQNRILDQLKNIMGVQATGVIHAMLETQQRPASNTFAALVGFAMLLLGASVVMGDLKYTLNKIWRVPARTGISGFLKDKLLSISMVLAIGFLLLVSLLASVFLSAFGDFLDYVLPVSEAVLQVLNFVISFGLVTLLFAAIFKILPNAKVRWGDVWIGAALTSLLFTIGKLLLALYLAKSTVGSVYGTAGSLLVMMSWVYYSAQILYFGAEFTKIHSDKRAGQSPAVVTS